MSIRIESFSTEEELSRVYRGLISDAIIDLNLKLDLMFEVPAPGCIPDMILFDREESIIHYLIAFEFKLSNWKRALYQAFKYRNFGNESYVILDKKRSRPAIKNIDQFKKANIGLITIDGGGELISWFIPEPKLPFSKEYSFDIACSLLGPEKINNEDLLFSRTLADQRNISKIKNIWSENY